MSQYLRVIIAKEIIVEVSDEEMVNKREYKMSDEKN